MGEDLCVGHLSRGDFCYNKLGSLPFEMRKKSLVSPYLSKDMDSALLNLETDMHNLKKREIFGQSEMTNTFEVYPGFIWEINSPLRLLSHKLALTLVETYSQEFSSKVMVE